MFLLSLRGQSANYCFLFTANIMSDQSQTPRSAERASVHEVCIGRPSTGPDGRYTKESKLLILFYSISHLLK